MIGLDADISESISCSVGINGSLFVGLYVGGVHSFPMNFRYPVRMITMFLLVLLLQFSLASVVFSSSGFYMSHILESRFSLSITECIVDFALPFFVGAMRS